MLPLIYTLVQYPEEHSSPEIEQKHTKHHDIQGDYWIPSLFQSSSFFF